MSLSALIVRSVAATIVCVAVPSAASAFLFDNDERRPPAVQAQMSGADAAVRIQQLEGQMRTMNGRIEQLEFQLRRMEDQLKRFQGDVDFRFQEVQGGGRPAARPPAPPAKRSDADPGPEFVPGATVASRSGRPEAEESVGSLQGPASQPRVLGQIPAGAGAGGDVPLEAGDPGAPLVIAPPGALPPRDPAGAPRPDTRPQIASAPSSSPRDEFDLGVGFVQRKDFELAEMTFRRFLEQHAGDRLAPEAQYWLGESLYQRGQYRDAAEVFLKVTTEAANSAKAPESMLRLGMSLSGLGEREAACATYAEIVRKYPRSSAGVRAQIDREIKRVKC